MKKGLSYFPLDTDFLSNRKIQRLSLKYGCEGITVFLATLCEIYGSNGFYCPVDEAFFFDIGFLTRTNEKQAKQIIEYCVEIRLFDSSFYRKKKVLTSCGIQLRYETIYKRNKRKVDPPYRILPDEVVSVTETPVIVTITPQKEKEKEKENKKEKENINTTETNYGKERKTNISNDDDSRRAELLRMAAAATANSRHA